MDETFILITGGSGLLGSELLKILPNAQAPTSKILDISSEDSVLSYFENNKVKMVIHCAAYMPPSNSDKNPDISIKINIIGTSLLVEQCIKRDIRLIYMSTDYVFKGDKGNYKEEDALYPVNKYAWAKLGGECAVRMCDKGVIVRASFGPNEFPYDKAFTNQWTSKEPVSIFAKKLVKVAMSDLTGEIHIGGNKKTVYEYAKEISPEKEIEETTIESMLPKYKLPKDTSLDTKKYVELFE